VQDVVISDARVQADLVIHQKQHGIFTRQALEALGVGCVHLIGSF
jgi:hypothetical protein